MVKLWPLKFWGQLVFQTQVKLPKFLPPLTIRNDVLIVEIVGQREQIVAFDNLVIQRKIYEIINLPKTALYNFSFTPVKISLFFTVYELSYTHTNLFTIHKFCYIK